MILLNETLSSYFGIHNTALSSICQLCCHVHYLSVMYNSSSQGKLDVFSVLLPSVISFTTMPRKTFPLCPYLP